KQSHVKQWGLLTQFPHHKNDGSADADQEAQQGYRSGPSLFGSLVENKDEPDHSDQGCQRTDEVEFVLGYLARVRDGSQRHGDGREDENDRQDEEPSPTGHVYQDSRHEHPQDATATCDGGPHTDRLGTLFGWEGRGNDRE